MVLVSAITIHGGQKFEATFEVLQIEEIADTLAPPPLPPNSLCDTLVY
jgi:hypothetical protein